MGQRVEVFDIREHKKALREKYKQFRRDMPSDVKRQRDESILSKLTGLEAYKNAELVLTYVSTEIEVDTRKFIIRALGDGKTVAVPRCIAGTRDMDFFIIKSLDDLERGTFSVSEPIPKKCKKLTRFDGAFCVVPALVYDREGFRLGYGKGYYDRFLSAHGNMYRVGICYCGCIATRLVHGRFDVPVNTIVTEKYIKNCGKAGSD